ncbi:MAG: hypothetical protein IJR18_07860 [Campylobacter sp.]|nr:hypothetical protein [Campylobacter sp.]
MAKFAELDTRYLATGVQARISRVSTQPQIYLQNTSPCLAFCLQICQI